jgi:hypothetical protein
MDYIPKWSYKEGIREFLQNALDQYDEDPSNKMSISYDESRNVMSIMNEKSVLEIKTLLLGVSGKVEGEGRGKYGEGYKVGTLALMREGKSVTIYNYGNREKWVAKVIKSRDYGVDILAFDVKKSWIWEKVPDANLTIEIGGISPDEYEDLSVSCLALRKDYTVKYATLDGKREILESEKPGMIYVGGLYVCTDESFQYSYNFHPSIVSLDRDRSLVRSFDLKWETASVWSSYALKGQKEMDEVIALYEGGNVTDLNGLFTEDPSVFTRTYHDDHIHREMAQRFIARNPDALPVCNDEQRKKAEEDGTKYVVVDKRTYHSIAKSGTPITPQSSKTKRFLSSDLLDFGLEIKRTIGKKRYERFLGMIDKVKELESK